MLRRTMIVGLLGLMLALAACGNGQTGAMEVGGVAPGTPGGFLGGGEMPLSMKLPAGTLLLEDTALAVTPEQAQELLPLWQMIRALQGSTTASQLELEATFGQIEGAMTPEQLAAIEGMDQEDMQSLFAELGMGRQQVGSESDDEEGGGFGGPPDAGGIMVMPPGGGEGGIVVGPGGGEGGPAMGPSVSGNLDPEARATAMAERGGMALGFGSGLTDAVIELLETRAAGYTLPQETGPPALSPEQEATATPEPVTTPAENTGATEAVEPTETPVPASTAEVVAVQAPAASTPVVDQASTAGLEGRFVFQVASGGDIYTVNADGSDLKRVTYGMDPDWSPDGSQITFTRWSEPWGIYIVNADGNGERLLFSSNVARAPVWSPDGTQIAFYFQTEGVTAPDTMCMPGGECRTMPGRIQTEWHVGVVDVADGYLHQPYVDRFSFSPTWSADGEWLVYDGGDSGAIPSEQHGLCVTTVEGPNNSVLTGNASDHYPVWSPDGTKIAFMHWQHDHWEIYVMNADGSDRHPLTSSSAYVKPRPNNVAPDWSPDGEQIVFLSDRSGEWEFYVMDADGSEQTQILDNVTDGLDIQYTGAYERVIS